MKTSKRPLDVEVWRSMVKARCRDLTVGDIQIIVSARLLQVFRR